MSDGSPGERRGWFGRLLQQFSGEPQDREALLTDLREASERGLLEPDALEMLEGVLGVSDMKVRDIMEIGRAHV